MKVRYFHITITVGASLKVYNFTLYLLLGGPLEERYLHTAVAVGGYFASGVLTHNSFFKAPSMKFESRVLTRFNGCWWPL